DNRRHRPVIADPECAPVDLAAPPYPAAGRVLDVVAKRRNPAVEPVAVHAVLQDHRIICGGRRAGTTRLNVLSIDAAAWRRHKLRIGIVLLVSRSRYNLAIPLIRVTERGTAGPRNECIRQWVAGVYRVRRAG